MIISIEDSLTHIYDSLKNNGYKVYRFSDSKPSDVVIYSGAKNHLSSISSSASADSDGMVLLIDGDNKSSDEIVDMINRKSYSSIF